VKVLGCWESVEFLRHDFSRNHFLVNYFFGIHLFLP
jgi:hypothetical protein